MSNRVSVEIIATKILEIRGRRVMLDKELAQLYGVATRDLNKAVKRNIGGGYKLEVPFWNIKLGWYS